MAWVLRFTCPGKPELSGDYRHEADFNDVPVFRKAVQGRNGIRYAIWWDDAPMPGWVEGTGDDITIQEGWLITGVHNKSVAFCVEWRHSR